jgi:hypothetical protein
VADDAPPPDPATTTEPKLTVSQERALRVEAARAMLGRGYSPSQVIAWLESPAIDKTWVVKRSSARKYVDEALEALDSEVVQPKNRKQARVRAMLTMVFQRAIELAHDPRQASKAAGLLTAAVAAADKIARVDGSYAFDGSSMIPASTGAASAEDAHRLVAHAQGLLELATRRGAMPQVTAGPPVIDATSVEVDEPDDELMDPGEDAN